MATKSNNTKGNPYHDDGGKFTSADGQGGGSASAEQKIKNMGFDDKTNTKESLAQKYGWTSKSGKDADHFLIENAINNLRKGYGVSEQESPINKEWADDIAYQLKNDGVSEQEIPALIETFKNETPDYETAHQNVNDQKIKNMGFDGNNSNENIKPYLADLDKYGEAIVGENGDRVYSITTDGEKYYGISYRTNYNGPIDGTEEEYTDGYNSFEEAVNGLEKEGFPLYDNLKNNNLGEESTTPNNNSKREQAISSLTEKQREMVKQDSREYSAQRDYFNWNKYLSGKDLEEFNKLKQEAAYYGKLADDEQIPVFDEDGELGYEINNEQKWHENGQKYVAIMKKLTEFLKGKRNPEYEAFQRRLNESFKK